MLPSQVGCRRQFKVIKFIGKGSFGAVYRVRRLSDGMEYAMKQINVTQMNASERKKAVNEIRILASLNSPYIVRFYEAFIENDSLFIVTDYAAQGDLLTQIKRHFKRKTHFPERVVWSFFIQLILGITYLHRHKILHRDLKSANIFVNNQTCIKIGDFGISKVCKPPEMLAKTQIGSPYYVSPEMWKNKPYGQKSDVWAIGCFLYEMVALHPPFQANSLERLAQKILTGKFDPLPRNTSPEISAMIRKLLTLDHRARPSCADILQTAAVQSRLHLLPRVEEFEAHDDLNFTQVDLLRSIATPEKPKDLKAWLPRARYPDFRKGLESPRDRGGAATDPRGGGGDPSGDAIDHARLAHHQNKMQHNQTDVDSICEVRADQFELPTGVSSNRQGRQHSNRMQPRFNLRRRPPASRNSPSNIKIGSRHEAKQGFQHNSFPVMRPNNVRRQQEAGSMLRGPPHALANMIRQDEMLIGGNGPGMHPRTNRGQNNHNSEEDINTGRRHFFPGIQPGHRGPGHRGQGRSMAGRAVDQMYGNQDDGSSRRGQHGQNADMMGAMVGNGLVDNGDGMNRSLPPVAESKAAVSVDFDNANSAMDDADNEWGV